MSIQKKNSILRLPGWVLVAMDQERKWFTSCEDLRQVWKLNTRSADCSGARALTPLNAVCAPQALAPTSTAAGISPLCTCSEEHARPKTPFAPGDQTPGKSAFHGMIHAPHACAFTATHTFTVFYCHARTQKAMYNEKEEFRTGYPS